MPYELLEAIYNVRILANLRAMTNPENEVPITHAPRYPLYHMDSTSQSKLFDIFAEDVALYKTTQK